jgi:hypothetical protein
MRAAIGMVVACVASWALVAMIPNGPGARDVGLGMAGPLAAAVGTWLMIERTVRVDPMKLTNRLLVGLLVKVVFFGAYVALAIRGLSAAFRPFAVSFAAYFIALQVVEAILLRRAMTRLIPGP